MMEFQSPQFLYFILPLCIGWLLLTVYSERRRRRAREAFAAQSMWSKIFPEESAARFWFKLLLRELAIIASLIALAGPRFGNQVEQVTPRGSDLYVLIDVSRSMLAEDVVPSRLGRAKADVSALLNRLDGERVGLIAFAGQAVVKCPLTIDYDSFRRALQELDPSSAPRGGTAIGDAIRKALEVFHAKVERDQSILLITDGDDQNSYPLEAAAIAAERKVAIYAVGLGDSQQGARIPEKGDSKNYVEYAGEQIWSKLDGSLLSEIALKTSGVYVPAGTKSYNLAELYTEHLKQRRASEGESQQRIRRSEQYQLFLGFALISLVIDACIASYRKTDQGPGKTAGMRLSKAASNVLILSLMYSQMAGAPLQAEEPVAAVREGVKLYSQEKYDAAQEKFAAAVEQLGESKSESLAIAAFDNACAYHRKGDIEQARENYLLAGLSQDRRIATTAHFNLGNLAAEQARSAAGEQPELLPVDKRTGVLDHLKQAVEAYRHCLELQPNHIQSRKNLELVRLWIKYYSDKWREQDRQKRRDESNLLAFLEYIMATQQSLRETTEALPTNATSDSYAELKLAQDELREEIPILRDKIESELKPPTKDTNGKSGNSAVSNAGASDDKLLEEGVRLLQGWADAAGMHMATSSKQFGLRVAAESATSQRAAIEELDKIWDAIIPFQPLLAKELAEQTAIAGTLKPSSADSVKEESIDSIDGTSNVVPKEPAAEEKNAPPQTQTLQIAENQLPQVTQTQQRTLHKSRMLAPRAEMELQQLEAAPAVDREPQEPPKSDEGSNGLTESTSPKQFDPEEAKAGLRKAIELAPKAVIEMESTLEFLQQKEWAKAYAAAEEARRILEEIQQAQPKNEQQNQDNQQQEQNQQQQEQQQDSQQRNADQQDPSKENKSDEKQNNKPEDKQKPDQQPSQDKQPAKPQVSPERMAEALRKVRERQQEKQDRDRQMRAQILGRAPVEKDW